MKANRSISHKKNNSNCSWQYRFAGGQAHDTQLNFCWWPSCCRKIEWTRCQLLLGAPFPNLVHGDAQHRESGTSKGHRMTQLTRSLRHASSFFFPSLSKVEIRGRREVYGSLYQSLALIQGELWSVKRQWPVPMLVRVERLQFRLVKACELSP